MIEVWLRLRQQPKSFAHWLYAAVNTTRTYAQALFREVASLKLQVAQLTEMLQTVVPSLPPSPSSSRMLSSP